MSELLAPDALPDVWIGKADAPITIIEYASMTCSHCAAFHEQTYPLVKDYIDTGRRVRPARISARRAGDRRLHDRPLRRRQAHGGRRSPVLAAAQLGVRGKPLDALERMVKQAGVARDVQKCIADKELYQNVLEVRQANARRKFGVDSTPTFFINGDRKNGEIAPGDPRQAAGAFLERNRPARGCGFRLSRRINAIQQKP